MMKCVLQSRSTQHVVHFEEWPLDCLVRYIGKKQRLLLTAMAPKIMVDITSLIISKANSPAWLRQLDDLFNSCVNRLVMQILRQDQKLLPYINQLIVAIERKLPLNINSFSVVFDYMYSIRQDHVTQKKIFELINSDIEEFRSGDQKAFYPQLFSAIETFESELFHLIDLQRKVLFPKISRMASCF